MDAERLRRGAAETGLEAIVDQQSPDLLVGDGADQLLDVDAAVAQRAAVAIGLGDLRGECDDPLETRLNFAHLTRFRGDVNGASAA